LLDTCTLAVLACSTKPTTFYNRLLDNVYKRLLDNVYIKRYI